MEHVQAFLTDRGINTEGFSIDPYSQAPAGSVCISVAGIFSFDMLLASPFTCTVRNKGNSSALTAWEACVNRAEKHDTHEALSAAKQAYIDFADERDTEVEAECRNEQTSVDDPLDAFMGYDAVHAAVDEARQKKQEMEKARQKEQERENQSPSHEFVPAQDASNNNAADTPAATTPQSDGLVQLSRGLGALFFLVVAVAAASGTFVAYSSIGRFSRKRSMLDIFVA